MQAQAIVNAAINTWSKGYDAHPKIMIPLVSKQQELELMRGLVEEVIAAHASELKHEIPVGTMIELPRACVVAGAIAEHADFFSFGTNDLTQTTMGVSRDDAGRFLSEYVDRKIVSHDPFASLDQSGVGKLVKMATKLGRNTTRDLKVGVCGEHGGDPKSIEFCSKQA